MRQCLKAYLYGRVCLILFIFVAVSLMIFTTKIYAWPADGAASELDAKPDIEIAHLEMQECLQTDAARWWECGFDLEFETKQERSLARGRGVFRALFRELGIQDMGSEIGELRRLGLLR